MPRVKIVLAYEGTAYSGWQIQEKINPPPTIQSAVETALFKLSGSKIRVYASGRTDAGVHALGQTAHFDMEDFRGDLRHSLNAILPPDIRILSAETVNSTFHARTSASGKTYIYNFWQEPAFIPPHLKNFVWSCGPLDLPLIENIIPQFLGEHDFASFCNAGTDTKTTQREIYSISIEHCPQQPWFPPHLPQIRLQITANGFLKQMVRNIAGYVAYIGKGKQRAQNLHEIFLQANRSALPSPTAPARGLFLAKVYYLNR